MPVTFIKHNTSIVTIHTNNLGLLLGLSGHAGRVGRARRWRILH